ncbi:MAG: N-acetyl-gamma-glutamyl-phosphate reductase [Pseudomonadales bacterium]|nr:N-acetyl-gamma-glutamyl-phosphate reductase [Pseudomonadales bacterium]NNM12636.1 N-acetyl-gamma-glutamyl-phosphate reductase [Pseudomonadales bacterium]RZV59208.1 MAG: N-acetyl-gamma-glutamyl-phosphate reductase [Pseudomonadales bacterium]
MQRRVPYSYGVVLVQSSGSSGQARDATKLRVGVVGATGYTGVELLRLLLAHEHVELCMVTSRAEAGTRLDSVWPSLRGRCELCYEAPDMQALANACELVFFATPHAVAMNMAQELLDAGCRIIDLSADFRLRDRTTWEHWYGTSHAAPQLLDKAIYALPEVAREKLAGAQLIACPGCYPTAVQLGFLPLLENKLVETTSLIANAASGVSGAGRQAKIGNLFAELSENFHAYAVAGHRHLPEIEQGLAAAAGESVKLTFVPHLLPAIRGIHATLYAKPRGKLSATDWQSLYEQRYADEPFVDVLPQGVYPETRAVRASNVCQISVEPLAHSNMLCVLAVEDNLTKGAAGQAIQAMNICYDYAETMGLENIVALP